MNQKGPRGYFGFGVEGISKPMNMGSLIRSAHAFGASFVFTVGAAHKVRAAKSDTSKTPQHVPYYEWDRAGDMILPRGCHLVGVELTEEAVDLPSFRHPLNAAYIMGPERGSLSEEMTAKCDFVVKIPTKFCLNVQIAGAVIMYDRLRSMGNYAPRALMPGGPVDGAREHTHGGPIMRRGGIKMPMKRPYEEEEDAD
ncbi:RNA methyltransferase [Tepidicaulis sp.]|uniref:RNA methyltransferase n=1 Tax=Tepidicaulis sp. TaxID=1920809 RepID=UPI003B592219